MPKSAKEIIETFFERLNELEGIDNEVTRIIQKLWNEGNLTSEGLLAALKATRQKAETDGKKED